MRVQPARPSRPLTTTVTASRGEASAAWSAAQRPAPPAPRTRTSVSRVSITGRGGRRKATGPLRVAQWPYLTPAARARRTPGASRRASRPPNQEPVGVSRSAPGSPGRSERWGGWGAISGPPTPLVRAAVVVAGRRLDALLGARDVALLELLELRDARHHVVALGRVADLRLLEPPLRLLLVAHQLLHRVPHRERARVRREDGDEDVAVPQRAQLLERQRVRVRVPAERGRVVERERQVRVARPHRAGEGDRRLARGARQLAPHEVHARGGGRAPAPGRPLAAPADRAAGGR